MPNVCCVVQYDGTDFRGFQRQRDAVTIQGELEKALYNLTGKPTATHGAGRTDAGVHARGQVFHFFTDVNIPPERWPLALNSRLPRSIVVTKARLVPDEFHARKSARAKVYDYVIYNDRFPSVFHDRFSLFVREPLDVQAMRDAAGFLVGEHDFAAFRATGSTPLRTTVRHLMKLSVTQDGPLITVRAEADGFLYHMMRNIVGTLLVVGRNKQPPEWVGQVLQSKNRQLAGPTAAARGLCLVHVKYG